MPLDLIPFDHANAITLAELCATVRGDRGGRLNLAIVQRWAARGWRGLLLPTVELGRRKWLMRQWYDAWQAERVRRTLRTEVPPKPIRPPTERQVAKAHQRAVKRLQKAGMI